MDAEVIEKYKQAGEIASKCVSTASALIKPGAKALDIAMEIDELIKKEGAAPAFPLNISINDIAAHYTPDLGADLKIGEEDIVKFDVGVHVDGYIADTAKTFSMSNSEEHKKLIAAVEAALDAVLKIIKPGVTLGEIGTLVEDTITERGYSPVRNLTGHGLDQYSLHAGLVVPNIKNDDETILEEGTAVAIEPFSTNGAGSVSDTNEIHIYEFLMERPTRNREARRILKMAQDRFNNLPFAKRWMEKELGKLRMELALRELVNFKALYQYPVLREEERGLVAQAEHTVLVLDKPVVTTL